ncbi:MAG: MoaD/ThiS family protein [Gemmatimonadales bacterium]
MGTVTVRFFARYAELAGRETTEIAIPAATTVADVVRRVRDTVPGAAALPERPLAALNLRQATPDAAVRDGDELALLPPLAGG